MEIQLGGIQGEWLGQPQARGPALPVGKEGAAPLPDLSDDGQEKSRLPLGTKPCQGFCVPHARCSVGMGERRDYPLPYPDAAAQH